MQDELTLLLGWRREQRGEALEGVGTTGLTQAGPARCVRACAELKSAARRGNRTESRACAEPPSVLLLRLQP